MLSTVPTFVVNELTLQKRVFFLNTHKIIGEKFTANFAEYNLPLFWKISQPQFHVKKKIKEATKLAIKKEKKGKKERKKERSK